MSKVQIGNVVRKKDGNGTYLKLNSNITVTDYKGNKIDFKVGDILNISDPRDDVSFLQKRGFIDEETASQRLKAIPDFVMFTISGKVNE